MKKSVKIRVICLIVAAIVLGGAVTAAAIIGSPYETLKKAMLDAMTQRSVTEESSATITVNGVVTGNERSYSVRGDNGSLDYVIDDDGDTVGFYYYSNGLNVSHLWTMAFGDGAIWYSAHVYPPEQYYYSGSSMFTVFSADDRNSAEMRFYELLLDLVVGDLKNNITMTAENGVRYISGALTGNQIPEIVKAGIDVLVEQSGSYYYVGRRDVSFDGREYIFENSYIERGAKHVTISRQPVIPLSPDEIKAWEDGTLYEQLDLQGKEFWGFTHIDGVPWFDDGPQEVVSEFTVPATQEDYYVNYSINDDIFNIPMQSLLIDYVRGEAEVDSDGNLLYLSVSAAATITDIFGTVNTVEITLSARFSDIGKSYVECPIPGAEQLLTPEFMKARFGSENMRVYFTLNEDGTINADSVTTTYPGELGMRLASDSASYPQAYHDPTSALAPAPDYISPPAPVPAPVLDPDYISPPAPVPDTAQDYVSPPAPVPDTAQDYVSPPAPQPDPPVIKIVIPSPVAVKTTDDEDKG